MEDTPAGTGTAAPHDAHGRRIDYLRISVTDRCNLRCPYCMGPGGVEPLAPGEILSYEEILRVASAAASLGIDRFRVTGGEPLLRRGICSFLEKLTAVPGVSRVSLTTNGTLLEDKAGDIRRAGVSRINISLDTLSPEKYREMTRGGDFRRVWRGIERTLEVGPSSVRLNAVLIRGINEDEILAFAELSRTWPIQVRFIEWMPTATAPWDREKVVTAEEALKMCRAAGELTEEKESYRQGPARIYRLAGAPGTIGFISPLSSPFCRDCNRLRLTSDGRLKPCLHTATEIDVRTAARQGTDEDIRQLIRKAISAKPLAHDLDKGARAGGRPMSRTGG